MEYASAKMKKSQSGKGAPMIAQFSQDESGATAIEYSLIAALIAIVILLFVQILGEVLRDKFLVIAYSIMFAGL